MKAKRTFNVLCWDFNGDRLVHYDVLPYLRRCLEERKKRSKTKRYQKFAEKDPKIKRALGMPCTWEELKEAIESESLHQFWGRCEYEMILTGWPARKNNYKLDVHEQIMMNIDTVTDILWEEWKP